MFDQEVFENLFEIPQRNGLTKPKRVRGVGVKIVNMRELFSQRRISQMQMDRVPCTENELASNRLLAHDLLFARQSLTLEGAGQSSIFLGDNEDVVFESHLIRCRLDQTKADPLYYFYFFQSEFGKQRIGSIVEQVAAAGIRGSDLVRLLVFSPPLEKQKAIAHILGTLDDKIEVNQKMNETLEEMARAIFKSWFVDFDPVRAKMEGRPTELPDDISDLFPNELVDSEIGQIPKGWTVSKIKDQCERLKVEKRYSNKIVQPTGIIPVLDQTTSTIIGFHSEPTFISASFKEPVVTFANHTCNIRLLFNNFSVIQNVIPLRPVKLPTLWFYLRILGVQKFEEYKGHIIDFMDKNLCFPSFESANALEQIVEPIFYKIESNTSENKTLAELRDTLLPKLISGEIRVADAERKMETAI